MRKNKIMVIAEAGVNHNGSVDTAKQLIDVAAEAGADCVKFQTYNTDDVITKSTPKLMYQTVNSKEEESQYDMIKALELSKADFHKLYEHCRKRNINFMSTPFDHNSLHFLTNDLDVSYIKIASNEITNGPLLLASAMTQKPIILSTGMSNLSDIENALSVIAFGYSHPVGDINEASFNDAYNSDMGQQFLKEKVSLLHCTSEYPTKYENVNLNAIKTLSTAFGLTVGYSDHTEGLEIPVAAVAMGAKIIEKHFTLSKKLSGPDHQASLEPDGLQAMIKFIRNLELALGDGVKKPQECEFEALKIMRRSLVASSQINLGEPFNHKNLTAKQPASGISPMKYWEYLNKSASKHYDKDEMVQ